MWPPQFYRRLSQGKVGNVCSKLQDKPTFDECSNNVFSKLHRTQAAKYSEYTEYVS